MEHVALAILFILALKGEVNVAYRPKRPPPPTGPGDPSCDKNGFASAVIHNEGKCYYFFRVERNWQDAVDHCESRNMYLVHLETKEEQSFIMQHLESGGRRHVDVWIGMKKTPAGGWAWFYQERMSPVKSPRWSTEKFPVPPDAIVAQTYKDGTFRKTTTSSRLPVVCEDPQSADLADSHCKTFNSQIKLGPFSDLHCYYIMSEQSLMSYPEAKAKCENSRAHLIFLETERESQWMDNELRVRGRRRSFWLGVERNGSEQWNWVYGHRSYPVPKPGFQTPNDYQRAIYTERQADDTWEGKPEVETEAVICEEDLYPKLMSQLLCFHHPTAIGRVYSHQYQHCYYIYLDDLDYQQAQRKCTISGHLLFAEKSEEQNMVEEEVSSLVRLHGKTERGVWLGLQTIEGKWVWSIPNGESKEVRDERWEEDSNSKQTYACTRPGAKWGQSTAHSVHHTVCESEIDEDLINERVCYKFRGEAVSYFNYATRTCYYIFYDKTDWSTTNARCLSNQTHVVHLKTENEKRRLMLMLADLGLSASVWIGAVETAPAEWSWVQKKHVYKLIMPAVVPLFEPSTKDAANTRLGEDGKWHRAVSTENHGVVCEDRLTLSVIRQAQTTNIGGQWEYGDRWRPEVENLGTTEFEDTYETITTTDITEYETTLTDGGETWTPDPRQTTLPTPGEETLTTLPTPITSRNGAIHTGRKPDRVCRNKSSVIDGSTDAVEFEKKDKFSFFVSELISLYDASNLKCAKMCATKSLCVVYTWSSELRICYGYHLNSSSSITLDCSGNFPCYVSYCRIPMPA